MLVGMNVENAVAMLDYVADKIIANKEYLTEIDSAIGDGDHGIGMAGGMKKAKEKLASQEFSDVYSVFAAVGKTMLMSMGGASGVIFGSMFLAGAKDAEAAAEIETWQLAAMLRGGLDAVKDRGKAQIGDKTMVDALEPAVAVLEESGCDSLTDALIKAEAAARMGMEDTVGYVAKFGRAKSLGERAVGHRDAGAVSVWLIFQGMREFAGRC